MELWFISISQNGPVRPIKKKGGNRPYLFLILVLRILELRSLVNWFYIRLLERLNIVERLLQSFPMG